MLAGDALMWPPTVRARPTIVHRALGLATLRATACQGIIILVGLLLVVPGCGPQVEPRQGPKGRSMAQLQALATTIRTYRLAYRRMPESLEALMSSKVAGNEAAGHRQSLLDPWGGLVQYEAHGTRLVLRSPGPDGVVHTADDLVYRDPAD